MRRASVATRLVPLFSSVLNGNHAEINNIVRGSAEKGQGKYIVGTQQTACSSYSLAGSVRSKTKYANHDKLDVCAQTRYLHRALLPMVEGVWLPKTKVNSKLKEDASRH